MGYGGFEKSARVPLKAGHIWSDFTRRRRGPDEAVDIFMSTSISPSHGVFNVT